MKIILPIIFVLFFTVCSFAQEMVDVIHFNSGNLVRGEILERNEETIVIQTEQGSVYTFRMEAVDKITNELKNKPRRPLNPKLLIFTSGVYTIPVTDSEFSDMNQPGPGVNFGGAYIFSDMLSLRLDIQYNDFPFRAGGSAISFSTAKLDLLIYSPIRETVNPYGLIGVGAFFLKKGGSANFRTNLGGCFGGGVSFKLSEKDIYLFVESQFNYNFTEYTEKGYIPIKIGFIFVPY